MHLFVTGTHRSGTTFLASMLARAPGSRPVFEPFSPAHSDQNRILFQHWFQYIGPENEERYLPGFQEIFRAAGRRKKRYLPAFQDIFRIAGLRKIAPGFTRRPKRIVLKEPTAPFAAEWVAERFGVTPVVTIRHPAAFIASNRRLGWTYNSQDLLDQPLLMSRYLSGLEDEIAAAARSSGQIDHLSVLWKAVYRNVARWKKEHSNWVFVRHEDLSRSPVPVLEEIYARLGLSMTSRVRSDIQAHTTRPGPYASPDIADIRRNSSHHLRDWQSLLSREEVTQIRTLTEPVASTFYSDRDW